MTVTTNGFTSNSVNFFVQVPTGLAPYDYPGAPNGIGPLRIVDPSGNVVDLNGNVIQSNVCGVYRNLAYQLVDQQRQAINMSAAITERFFNYAGPAGTPPPFTTTTSAGFLQDTQFIGRAAFDCLLPGEIEEFNQDFVVTIGTTQYVLTSVVFVQRGRNSNGYFVSVSIDQP